MVSADTARGGDDVMPPDRDQSWVGWVALLLYAAIGVGGYFGNLPPEPLPKSSQLFSAESAHELMVEILGDEIPHPAGSPQNIIIRDRIVEMVKGWGYAPELHETEWQRRGRRNRNKKLEAPVPLTNIVVRRQGRSDLAPILVVSHFDSAPASPGISDDGLGLAVSLEIARRLSLEEPPERDVLFLITDGEEFGLLGAERWCQERLPETDVGIAINVEARGTSGASLMFQTGPDSRWLVQQFAKSSRRPKTSSLFYEVYRFLPNDTDFTVLDRHGVTGFNFAIVGDVNNYHTPYDNLANLSLDSLQHHGENVLGLVRVLQASDLEDIPVGRAVYFDLFGLWVMSWPAGWSFWMSLLLLGALVLVGRGTGWNQEQLRGADRCKSVGKMVLAFLATTIVVGVFVFLFRFEMHFQQRWMEQPLPIQLAIWVLGTLVLLGCVSLCDLGWKDWLVTIGLGWGVISLLTSATLAGVSYMSIVPLSGVVVGLMVGHVHFVGAAVPVLISIFLGAVIWLPMETLIYDALGFHPIVYGPRVAISLLVLTPGLALLNRRNRVLLAVLLATGFVIAVVLGLLWN